MSMTSTGSGGVAWKTSMQHAPLAARAEPFCAQGDARPPASLPL
jgi:hypothetical protein